MSKSKSTKKVTLSELNILDTLELCLKKKRLIPNNIARTKAIFDFPIDLNIFYIKYCFYNNSNYKGN